MKTIYRIARVELYAMFFSPVAWLVLVIFTVQSGLSFVEHLKGFVQMQESGYKINDITFWVFLYTLGGFFREVVDNLYLYVPLLTMGLMSREISSGSIKLLLSSPVRVYEIVMGKFLAMMIYCFALMLILLLIMFMGNGSIENMDLKAVFSGWIGIYLLICTYSAIGIFMSSLTSYQVVAAISTLAMLAVLNYIRQVGQGLDVMRKITYFLSLAGRTNTFISGLIISKDVLYFFLIMVFFLGLTVMKLNDGRSLRSGLVKAGRYLGLAGGIILLGYLSSRPLLTGYYDMTINKNRTLTSNSQQIIKQIKTPVQVTEYVNLMDGRSWGQMPERRNDDIDYWDQYVRFIPDLKLNYVYYYDTVADSYLFKVNKDLNLQQVAKKISAAWEVDMDMFLKPAQMRQQIDLASEDHQVVREVELGGKKTFLRMYDEPNPNPSEQEISAGLKRLLVSPPKVAYLTGEYERKMDMIGDQGYKYGTIGHGSRHALINQGFDVLPVNLLEEAEIPTDLTALAIIDPRAAFKPMELEKISHYLAEGGNMIIAGEPNKQAILNPILKQLGVRMMDGVLIQQSKEYSPDYIRAGFSEEAGAISDKFNRFRKDSGKVIMPGSVGLDYSLSAGYAVIPLVVTNERNTWDKLGEFAMDTGKVTYNPERGDIKKAIPLALALTRTVGGKQQRIIVLGDADYMSNRLYPNQVQYPVNYALGEETYRWLCYGAFPIDVTRPETQDKRMKIGRDQLKVIKFIFVGVIPGVLLIAGVVLLIRRKRK